jgi:hypothetical protein
LESVLRLRVAVFETTATPQSGPICARYAHHNHHRTALPKSVTRRLALTSPRRSFLEGYVILPVRACTHLVPPDSCPMKAPLGNWQHAAFPVSFATSFQKGTSSSFYLAVCARALSHQVLPECPPPGCLPRPFVGTAEQPQQQRAATH